MKILITGGAGFVGQALLGHLLDRGKVELAGDDGRTTLHDIEGIVCLDRGSGAIVDPRVRYVVGDISRAESLEACFDADTGVVFHLAAVVSGTAEADLDLGMRVNLDGMRHLLARSARLGHCPHLIFSSSIAVFGVGMPAVVDDQTQPMPLLSYGAQKLCGEVLLHDHRRRGVVRGCSLRLPAVVVRPGSPNGAATGFSSAVWREPLAGRAYSLPVPRQTRMWCASPRVVAGNLVHALRLAPRELSPWSAINLPGRAVSMQDAVDALERIAGIGGKVGECLDPTITEMSKTWACEFETPRALALGFERDADADALLQAYIRDCPADVRVPLRA
ncbi:MAG: NAD-dependent epimerase/dehydratase family protein [Burkholderiaceae bacterium]